MDMLIESFRDVAIVTLSGAQLDAVNAKEFKKGVNELIQTEKCRVNKERP